MPDEAAFLDALAANPADDTARLVYTDWLDEHGEPYKAEYLRLVVALARAETDYARDQPDVARTLALAEALPADWRAAAGSRFNLVLYAYLNVAKKIALIKAVRSVTGRGLAEVLGLVETAPSTLLPCVPFERALIGRDEIREPDGVVYLHLCERDDAPVAIRCELRGQRWPFAHPVLSLEDKEILCAALQNAWGISGVLAARLANDESVVVCGDLARSEGEAKRLQLTQLLRERLTEVRGKPPRFGVTLYLVPSFVSYRPE
ncbi:ribosomal protein L7/L12 [Gemmata sp.]|uniref:ribosomal protein L7/L12 n=1 Tax=Gemmata sp. TaxID=1914242 RepID=UPI003F6F1FD4